MLINCILILISFAVRAVVRFGGYKLNENEMKKKIRNIKYYALNFLIATAARNPAKSFRRCNVFEFKRILGNIVLLLYGMHLAGTIAAGNNGNGCT